MVEKTSKLIELKMHCCAVRNDFFLDH